MPASLSAIIQIHKDCGCPTIDAETVKVGQLCLSTDDTISGLSQWGEQIEVKRVTDAPATSYSDLIEISDDKLEIVAGVQNANTTTYQYGTAKAVVYDDGTDAYLAYIQNYENGNGDMDILLQKLFRKLLDDGRILFYYRMLTLYDGAIETFEGNFTIEVISAHELYEE